MALGTKTGGKPFEQGNKLAKGGRRNPPGGRPSNAQLAAKTAMIEIWEKELAKKERKVAARYAEQALKDNRETGVMPAFLLFWVSFPFGFQLVLHQFSLGTSCPFRGGALIGPTHCSDYGVRL